jgi:hypothetical protein
MYEANGKKTTFYEAQVRPNRWGIKQDKDEF